MTNITTPRPKSGACALLAVTAVLAGTSVAPAGFIEFQSDTGGSTEGLGLFTGSLQFASNVFGGTGILTVTLTNTSDPDNGGFLTGFVFNFGSADPDIFASLTSASHPFEYVSDAPAPPFGTYDAGAALGGDWLGGGSPNGGIAVGHTGVFEFLIQSNDIGSLTVANIVGGPGSNSFVVRFRGFEDGGSDKVPGSPIPTVPGPAALGLLLAGLAGSRRRRG